MTHSGFEIYSGSCKTVITYAFPKKRVRLHYNIILKIFQTFFPWHFLFRTTSPGGPHFFIFFVFTTKLEVKLPILLIWVTFVCSNLIIKPVSSTSVNKSLKLYVSWLFSQEEGILYNDNSDFFLVLFFKFWLYWYDGHTKL